MAILFKILGPNDLSLLRRVAPDMFDHEVNPDWAGEFLADPWHHLAAAIEGDRILGFASAVHYIHPDKPPELWINEVGVAPTHQNRGVGRQFAGVVYGRPRTWMRGRMGLDGALQHPGDAPLCIGRRAEASA